VITRVGAAEIAGNGLYLLAREKPRQAIKDKLGMFLKEHNAGILICRIATLAKHNFPCQSKT